MHFANLRMTLPFMTILLMMMLLMTATGCGGPKAIIIDATGKTGNFKSIREGLAEWKPGLPITIHPGKYNEQLILKTKMAIVGKVREKVVIEYSGEGPTVYGKDASSISLQNVTLKKVKGKGLPSAVVDLKSSDIEMKNCTIQGGGTAGIQAEKFSNLVLRKSSVQGSEQVGVVFSDQSRGKIEDSELKENLVGVSVVYYPEGVPKEKTMYRDAEDYAVFVENSKIESNKNFGLVVEQGSELILLGNQVKKNGIWTKEEEERKKGGNLPQRGGIVVQSESKLKAMKNRFEGNLNGAWFAEKVEAEFKENEVVGNEKYGVVAFRGDEKVVIEENLIAENGAGGAIREGMKVQVKKNKFKMNRASGLEVHDKSQAVIEGNLFLENGSGMLVKDFSKPRISGNLFVKNKKHGLITMSESSPVVSHNTFYFNAQYGAWFVNKSKGEFYANAVVGSTIGLSLNKNGGILPKIDYNCFWNNKKLSYQGLSEKPKFDINMDPQFADPERLNFAPLSDSPLKQPGYLKGYIGAIKPLERAPDADKTETEPVELPSEEEIEPAKEGEKEAPQPEKAPEPDAKS